VLGTLISTPGVSQLLGCTPLGPLAWSQALGCAGAATAGAALIPRLLDRADRIRSAATRLTAEQLEGP
jgi:hypothetical protein